VLDGVKGATMLETAPPMTLPRFGTVALDEDDEEDTPTCDELDELAAAVELETAGDDDELETAGELELELEELTAGELELELELDDDEDDDEEEDE